jgi:MFS family permease
VSGSTSYGTWIVAAVLLGLGTAMVYPRLLAAVGDVAHPMWRARAVGVYRLWRDGGFAAGALFAGLIADLWGLTTAIWVAAALTASLGCRRPIACARPASVRHRPLIGTSRSIGSTDAANRRPFPRDPGQMLTATPTLDL